MNDDKTQIISFGLKMLKTILIGTIIAIIIGALTGTLVKTAVFLVCIFPLRQYAGGYHLKSKVACVILSTLILLLVVWFMKYEVLSGSIQVFTILCAALFIVGNAPVDNIDNLLNIESKKQFRKKTFITLGAEIVVFGTLFLLKLYPYSQIICISVVLTAVLILGGLIKNAYQEKDMMK